MVLRMLIKLKAIRKQCIVTIFTEVWKYAFTTKLKIELQLLNTLGQCLLLLIDREGPEY